MRGLRDELPWLAGREVLAANQAGAGTLLRDLARLEYSVRQLEGERIVSDESFRDAVARAFSLPLDDALAWAGLAEGIVALRVDLAEREAVVWHRADASAFFSLRTVVEGVTALLSARRSLEPEVRLEVVLLGNTRDFPHPEGR